MLRQFSVLPPPPLPSRSPPLRPVPRLLLPSDGFSLYLLHSRRRRRRRPLVIVLRSGGGDRWRLTDLDPNAVQDRLRSWLLKARTLLTEVATPLVKPGQGRKLATARELENMDVEEEVFVASEMTVDRRTTNGFLSFAAVVSIEQFARMNGLTGRKMQKIFEALAPETIRTDARSLVEYCCFRYLSRDSSDIHPSLKEHAFQRLIFVTMLAWEQPYTRDGGSQILQDASSFQGQLVGEDAFVRIAPAVAGVSDVSTAHHLFKALAGDEQERAALTCKEKSRIVEKTQATIDAAMIKGIPSNIDLFKVTFEVAVVLLGSAIILLVIPFKYILAFIIFDLFTRELQFRKEMVVKFVSFLRERWAGIHAAPVVVLPYESPKTVTEGVNTTNPDRIKSERILGNGSAANLQYINNQSDLNQVYYGPAVPSSNAYGSARRCSSCFCCSRGPGSLLAILGLTIFMLAFIISMSVFLFVFVPPGVDVYVNEASLAEFNYSSDSHNLKYNLSLAMSIRKPNKRISIYFDNVEALAIYDGCLFDFAVFSAFDLGHKSTANLSPAFQGAQLLLGDSAATTYAREKSEGYYYIDMNVRAKLRLKGWVYKLRYNQPNIACRLKLPVPGSSGTFKATEWTRASILFKSTIDRY
ncbi:hypothetical protein MUK42_18588 [Musa troglodytarum]|uniref:Uncharacterized protein n=1 Tax=Musa troglodytarum TaxID=320322 RepID=A0A9E7EKB8_9LILI|nr:hypothetical protein MUK42_18588 [Musa troglodytarum]